MKAEERRQRVEKKRKREGRKRSGMKAGKDYQGENWVWLREKWERRRRREKEEIEERRMIMTGWRSETVE